MRHRGFEPRTPCLKGRCSTDWANGADGLFSQEGRQPIMPVRPSGYTLAGMAGLEPASEGVKVPCLTTWLWHHIYFYYMQDFLHNDSKGIWTPVTAVKGRCLNRLTMEPKKKKTPRVGLEPTTTRLTAECSTIELSRIIKVCTFKTSYKSDLFFSVINQIKPSTY